MHNASQRNLLITPFAIICATNTAIAIVTLITATVISIITSLLEISRGDSGMSRLQSKWGQVGSVERERERESPESRGDKARERQEREPR